DFTSEWGYKLDFTALDQDKDKAKYSVLSIRQESEETEDGEKHRYHVTVMMTKGAVSDFIKKVELYITENVIWKGEDTGNPRFYKLFSNIDIIRKATLKSFW